ncbi:MULTISPECIES: PTS sugar transporter subunit IIA [Yersinia]|uniref:PTS sugar transporter subunit IIA n=1 Tax=Yersinia TaxID=629 RepID=UPI0005E853ED|nr:MULTISPECIES: PTS sugar transporter subunit IIA [Yersinia]OVZ96079.1 PTS sugar transporter subunit IIA [Yersinia frederiksenii]RXA96615.1 PTS sugar transporter subunit IIA [Yersinia sp. 2105 StPb PI]CNI76487.1 phosphotransferase enzyme II%2C A component [Yersinia frederiksenii]CNK51484.1 phosphotransferase enzyme II%2C A component [Yersinia frederiksenii]
MDIIFNHSLLSLNKEISTPEESIRYAGQLMANQGICSEAYIDEMCHVFQVFGSAIVLDYGIAMPHARPEKGALKTGFSLVTVVNPLNFGHEEFDPIKVVIAISGADADSHIKMIQLIATLIESGIVDFLENENDHHTVMDFIQREMEESLC